jgi:hypothetical protein
MTKVGQNERFTIGKKQLVENIKKEYNFNQNPSAYKQYTDSINTDRFYTNNWTEPKIKNTTIFSIGKNQYTTDELSTFLKDNTRRRVRMNKSELPIIAFKELYEDFISEKQYLMNRGCWRKNILNIKP